MGEPQELFEGDEEISRYSRKEAIEDGTLIDQPIGKLAREQGIRWHVALTAALYSDLQPLQRKAKKDRPDDPLHKYCEDEEGVLWDVLTLFKLELGRRSGNLTPGDEIPFKVKRQNSRYTKLKAVFGLDFLAADGRVCIEHQPNWTLMLPEED